MLPLKLWNEAFESENYRGSGGFVVPPEFHGLEYDPPPLTVRLIAENLVHIAMELMDFNLLGH